MILVAGSTGLAGSEICRMLAVKGIPFRALVRQTSDPAKVERIKGYGAELAKGDLRDPASLKAACRGVDTLICTVSAMPFSYQPGVNDIHTTDLKGVLHLIDAAKTAGVRHFIHTSFSGNIDRIFPLLDAKRAVEQYLQESGLDYTILRPSYFMELWLSPIVGFEADDARATIYGTGKQPIAWISFKDLAGFAVECVENPAARNRILELGGPQSLSPHQVIRLFEEAEGRTFEVIHVSPQALLAQFDGVLDPMQKSFIGLMLCYADGDLIDMKQVQQEFSVHLTPVHEFISSVIQPV